MPLKLILCLAQYMYRVGILYYESKLLLSSEIHEMIIYVQNYYWFR